MGKRSNFERVPRDFYPTPYEAVVPLLRHLHPETRFCEPCAGDGALVKHLENAGHTCVLACDTEPRAKFIEQHNALTLESLTSECFITNPPWDRKILHPLIEWLSDQAPTWFLFDADWMHTKQAIPYLPRLNLIVAIGRIKWIPDSKFTGKDNCCWYMFDRPYSRPWPQFQGRIANG